MRLVEELSEPYSIFTYLRRLSLLPNLLFCGLCKAKVKSFGQGIVAVLLPVQPPKMTNYIVDEHYIDVEPPILNKVKVGLLCY
ncbi:hypothetical protein FEM48_Zijuj10G0078800 [Ziziphus jujuba var. spinosa]|uniref:Uncharacterized protein n=1 Tax=Ziziphus jujuba var. spinosa TaxID=714518 RepID=A0A978UM62_ZIZJJ|nr:hypothetical protein FEM48_Zijuj10G0078800 [Ziziphus jujuba var. spinosa]